MAEYLLTRMSLNIKPTFIALRPHQWSKNLLLFIPLMVSSDFLKIELWGDLILAFFSFSFIASGSYIFNDLLDLENDKNHPIKKNRPLASNALDPNKGKIIALFITILGISIGSFLTKTFLFSLALYLLIVLIYNLILRSVVLADCFALSFLFTLRVISAAFAVELELSFWMLFFSIFFFFSLSLLKRFSELVNYSIKDELVFGRGYKKIDIPFIQNLGISSGLISVLILGLYLKDPKLIEIYNSPESLLFFLPVLLIWISSMWFYAFKGKNIHDPISFALNDTLSLILLLLSLIIFYVAKFI